MPDGALAAEEAEDAGVEVEAEKTVERSRLACALKRFCASLKNVYTN